MQIITVVIKSENDIILARQRAKQLSALIGFSFIDQTRFVTAVSEISRNAVMYGNGGKIEFSIGEKDANQILFAKISDHSDQNLEKILENSIVSKNGMGIGIKGTKNLMDYFLVQNHCSNGNIVTFGKIISSNIPYIKVEQVNQWVKKLTTEKPKGFLEEIQQQNQVLLKTLEKLEESEKKLQEKLDETVKLNEELQKANQDLKDFAYIVSHDLKAPLRGISSLAGWLSSDYGSKLGEEGNAMIEMLLGRIKRMNGLIDGILQYSRVGRTTDEKVLINIQDIVEGIIKMIKPPNNIKIIIDNNLPQIYFEEVQIIQIFQNLIENAVKYMNKEEGLVEIGSIDEDTNWKFYVKDNGPGIDLKYKEKIFKIFQTLNSRDKVEGTGIGLCIVKKIVELYNGRIWFESTLDEGTTFFFTISKGTN